VILQYGSYQHDQDEVGLEDVQREIVYSDRGYPQKLQETWTLKGRKRADTQALILAALSALRAAYSVNGHNAVLLDNDGAETLFKLDTNRAQGGVRVLTPVAHSGLINAQLSTYCDYRIVLQADFLIRGAVPMLKFEESLTFSDIRGGPITVEIMPAVGEGVIQAVTEKSFYHATQSGNLTSLQRDPQPPNPIWPDKLRGQIGTRDITRSSPPVSAGEPVQYAVAWNYQFVSKSPLIGSPTTPN
jgi:hypothetical protein